MPPSSFAMGGAKRNVLFVPYLDLREMNAGMIWTLSVPSYDILMLPSRLLVSRNEPIRRPMLAVGHQFHPWYTEERFIRETEPCHHCLFSTIPPSWTL
jgi:hypothetical protein